MQVIERDIVRNVEIIDLSLRAVVDNLRAPETGEASPKARQMILFDRAASARDLGVMLVLDGNGDSSLVITQNQYAAGVAARSDVITAQTQLQTTEALSIAVDTDDEQMKTMRSRLADDDATRSQNRYQTEPKPDLPLSIRPRRQIIV